MVLKERSSRSEILDCLSEEVSPDELRGNLRDIRRANRFFGGTKPVLNVVSRIERERAPCTLLDIATGSADIPAAIVQHAERTGWDLRVVATDIQPDVLAVARAAELPDRLVVERADARNLPYPSDSFDIVTLSLALHHFQPNEALMVLSEMRRVGRRALVVNDLSRSQTGYVAAWLFANLATRNRLTRHDAPLSVLRAYTQREALSLAAVAGWRGMASTPVFPFRYMLVGRP